MVKAKELTPEELSAAFQKLMTGPPQVMMAEALRVAESMVTEYSAVERAIIYDQQMAAKSETIRASREMNLMRDMAGMLLPAAVLSLGQIASNPTQTGAARVAATNALREMRFGRVTTHIHALTEKISEMPTEEAVNAVLRVVEAGNMSVEQVNAITRLLEAKASASELARIKEQIKHLEEVWSRRSSMKAVG